MAEARDVSDCSETLESLDSSGSSSSLACAGRIIRSASRVHSSDLTAMVPLEIRVEGLEEVVLREVRGSPLPLRPRSCAGAKPMISGRDTCDLYVWPWQGLGAIAYPRSLGPPCTSRMTGATSWPECPERDWSFCQVRTSPKLPLGFSVQAGGERLRLEGDLLDACELLVERLRFSLPVD